MGLSNSWDRGPIYCSSLTEKLLRRRFPKLKNITGLELNKKYKLYLDKDKTLEAEVTMFDANHIFGSAMILFEGYTSVTRYFGKYLHTGDLRFHEYMWEEYKYLWPPELGKTPEGIPKSIQIDELIFDNTYCDPIFDFPLRVE